MTLLLGFAAIWVISTTVEAVLDWID